MVKGEENRASSPEYPGFGDAHREFGGGRGDLREMEPGGSSCAKEVMSIVFKTLV